MSFSFSAPVLVSSEGDRAFRSYPMGHPSLWSTKTTQAISRDHARNGGDEGTKKRTRTTKLTEKRERQHSAEDPQLS